MLDYKLTNFSNGLRLITAPLKNTKAVTVLFLLGTGSRYESNFPGGISHFLEHMVFKGTEKRPTNLDISKALDSVGADYNAFTSEEYTGFYVRAASEHFDLALDILYDILYNAKFEEAEVEKEKGVIAEEINMRQDIPQAQVYELAKKLFYGEHLLGLPVTGSKESISQINSEKLIEYRDKFYTGENMVVVVAGDGEEQIWQEKIEKMLSKIPKAAENDFQKADVSQDKPASALQEKKTDQAHLVLAFKTVARTDKTRPIFKVLNNLFGENMSSRLFTEVREKRGLAYYISSELGEFRDQGVLAVAAGVDVSRAEEAVGVILDEFKKLRDEKVTEEELSIAKENLKGKFYLSLEESFVVAEFLADQELFWKKIKNIEEIIDEFKKVSAEEIQALAKEYFKKENLNLAIIGPFEKKENFQTLLEGF